MNLVNNNQMEFPLILIQTPEWPRHAVFYQIFPDRFARSPRMRHPPGMQFLAWGTDPAEQGFQGGDLYGVVDKLDYLQELGVTALYLNPIFAAASNHRYTTFDYYQVDPILGGNDALRELLDEAHGRGMRVMLDGVFNHVSRGFWPFHHVLENGPKSPYGDWFVIQDWPLHPYDESKPANYDSWWGYRPMPEFNTDHPAVRAYIFDVARHWIDFGIDAWRLDVPYDIDDDEFWREFRRVVKAANPEAYIVGEVWKEAKRWLQGDMFDSVMNYIFNDKVMGFVGGKTLRTEDYSQPEMKFETLDGLAFGDAIDEMYALYDREINHVQFNLIDSHDTPRALWMMGEDKDALRLALLLQMTLPGTPCIYYGDEIGMTGGPDPDCRQAFPWQTENHWDHDLLADYKATIRLFNQYEVLRIGDYQRLIAKGDLFVFERRLDGKMAVIVINAGAHDAEVTIPVNVDEPAVFNQVWPSRKGNFSFENGSLRVAAPARKGLVYIK